MTWEILARGGWSMIGTTLGAIALPLLIVLALRHEGPISAQDSSIVVLHIVFIYANTLMFGATVFSAQGRISQLYAHPLTSSTLVTWRLLPAMALIAAQTMASIAVLNVLLDLEWPVVGPALAAAVAVAAFQAVAWLTEKSTNWLIIGVSIVAVPLGMWFTARYGPPFSDPTHYWYRVTLAEVLAMLSMTCAAYGVAVVAVARNRCGDPPISLGLMDWLDRTITPAFTRDLGAATPFRAQCWLEWRKKGWIMPAGVASALVVGFFIWLVFSRQAEDLFVGTLYGAGVLNLVALVGSAVFGNIGGTNGDDRVGQFQAARPLSDSQMAYATLMMAGRSLLIAWSVWLAAFVAVCGGLYASGAGNAIQIQGEPGWYFVPAIFAGTWLITATIVPLVLLGRGKSMLPIWCFVMVGAVVLILVAKFLMSESARILLAQSVTVAVSVGIVIACGWILAAAARRKLVGLSTVWAAISIWATVTLVIALYWPGDDLRLIGFLVIAALVAMVVASVASAPLALSANRHR
jgi:hypothetical protein